MCSTNDKVKRQNSKLLRALGCSAIFLWSLAGAEAQAQKKQPQVNARAIIRNIAKLERRVTHIESKGSPFLDLRSCVWNLDATVENLGPGTYNYPARCGGLPENRVMLDAVLFKVNGNGIITQNATNFIGTDQHHLPVGKNFQFTVDGDSVSVEANKLCCPYPAQ